MLKIFDIETSLEIVRDYLITLNRASILNIELKEITLQEKDDIVYSFRYSNMDYKDMRDLELFSETSRKCAAIIMEEVAILIDDESLKRIFINRIKKIDKYIYKSNLRILKGELSESDRKKGLIINFLYKYWFQKFQPFKYELELYPYFKAINNNFKVIQDLRELLKIDYLVKNFDSNLNNIIKVNYKDFFFGDYLNDIEVRYVNFKIDCLVSHIDEVIRDYNDKKEKLKILFESPFELERVLKKLKSFHVETNFVDIFRVYKLKSFIFMYSILRKCNEDNFKRVLGTFLNDNQENFPRGNNLFPTRKKKNAYFMSILKEIIEKNNDITLKDIKMFFYYLSFKYLNIYNENKSLITIDYFGNIKNIKPDEKVLIIPTNYEIKDKIDNSNLLHSLKINLFTLKIIKSKAKEVSILLDERLRYPLQIESRIHSIGSLFYLNLKVGAKKDKLL